MLGGIILISAGAIGATIYHQNQPKSSPKPTVVEKPKVRQTNSGPTLLNIINEYRTEEDLKRSIDNFEIVFWSNQDHQNGSPELVLNKPTSPSEPYIVKSPLGIGAGVDKYIMLRFIEYRLAEYPDIRIDQIVDMNKWPSM